MQMVHLLPLENKCSSQLFSLYPLSISLYLWVYTTLFDTCYTYQSPWKPCTSLFNWQIE